MLGRLIVLVEGVGAVVTGGASGLGAAVVRRLVKGGATVTVLDRKAEVALAMAQELGNGTSSIAVDVSERDQVVAAMGLAAQRCDLRIVVHCAGLGVAGRVVEKDGTPHDARLFERAVRVNLIGTANVLCAAAAEMAKLDPVTNAERGVIINTASIAAFDGQIGQLAYAATKAAVVGMTLPAARDLASIGVRVLAIAPGTFDTPMLASLPETNRASLADAIPFPKRLGDPDEFAALALALITNQMMNGETIRIDGAIRMAPR
jgi:NAD(P)-dependent dehydrogenase (short-subunit alcohol dehydrogenase family)